MRQAAFSGGFCHDPEDAICSGFRDSETQRHLRCGLDWKRNCYRLNSSSAAKIFLGFLRDFRGLEVCGLWFLTFSSGSRFWFFLSPIRFLVSSFCPLLPLFLCVSEVLGLSFGCDSVAL